MLQKNNFWDSNGLKKKFTIPFDFPIFFEEINTNSSILDYGCGYGRVINLICDKGYNNVFGCDISLSMLYRAKQNKPELNFFQIDSNIITLPCKNSSFEAIFLIAVLTCIIDDKKQFNLVKELKRVLKPDGYLFVSDFLLNNDERNIKRYNSCLSKFGTYGIFETEDKVYLRHHSIEHILNLFKDFSVISLSLETLTTMNNHTSNGFYLSLKNKVN